MSDTGPAELASLVEDERKFRMYMVLSVQEIKQTQAAHEKSDEQRFAALESKVRGVSSSVQGHEGFKNRLQGGWVTVVALCALVGFLIEAGIKIWDHLAK